MHIKIIPNATGSPAGKLADAELWFDQNEPLAGLKLIGFAVWESRSKAAGRNVTFPARQYSINGERRSYALLRPSAGLSPAPYGDPAAQDRIRDLILSAFAAYEADGADTYTPPAPTPAQATTAGRATIGSPTVEQMRQTAADAAQARAQAEPTPDHDPTPATQAPTLADLF